jgi:hypothetical protein
MAISIDRSPPVLIYRSIICILPSSCLGRPSCAPKSNDRLDNRGSLAVASANRMASAGDRNLCLVDHDAPSARNLHRRLERGVRHPRRSWLASLRKLHTRHWPTWATGTPKGARRRADEQESRSNLISGLSRACTVGRRNALAKLLLLILPARYALQLAHNDVAVFPFRPRRAQTPARADPSAV